MNAKSVNKFFRVVLSSLIFFSASLSYAANETKGTPAGNYENISVTEEAARAVFGRVFGAKDQGADIDYHVVEFYEHSPGNAAFRSALVPGWGQGFNGQYKKGSLLFGTFVIAAFGSYTLYRRSGKSYDDYKARGLAGDSSYDDYKREHLQSVVLGSAAAILWGFAIYDSASQAYKLQEARNPEIKLGLLKDGAIVELRKSF